MSKFKMTVFSEIPVHPITLDEVKGGLANPLGNCTGGACYGNICYHTVICKDHDNCEGNTGPCNLNPCTCHGSSCYSKIYEI